MTAVRIEYVIDFYQEMSKWWLSHGWKPLPLESLPEKVFILSRDGLDAYCCTLYQTDSDFAVLAWQISNKEAKREKGDLKKLFLYMEEYAKATGVKIIFTTSGTDSVISELSEAGYQVGDTNINQYIKWVEQ